MKNTWSFCSMIKRIIAKFKLIIDLLVIESNYIILKKKKKNIYWYYFTGRCSYIQLLF